MARVINPKAEELLDKEFKVLNHGFVRLVDYMGGDESIVQAARVSYGKGTKTVSEDRTLIRYLMRHQHTTPFEMVELKFHIKLPIFVARQWIRHRTANVNEYSGRYSIMPEEFYVPEESVIKYQSTLNKQGRDSEEVPPEIRKRVLEILLQEQKSAFNGYQEMLEYNIARELARINLPLSLYTQWYWKIDLHNLFHFLKLRMDKHAQYEIRVYAEKMAEIVKAVVPIAYEAFEDYVLNSVTFSKNELLLLKKYLPEKIDEEEIEKLDFSKYEKSEFFDKLKKVSELK
ncbi:MAG: FAD-dependent thymidylate synthase [Ignavibacteria bacterium]|nr:FAD-dependent thymidylate synthase [Ignavibacteria bacterium]MDH7528002.1 FAD-dependent thymidylate synthase [Ignavibacteria bacterium]